MIALKNLIEIDRSADTPIYLQINNALIHLIKNGILESGLKLPGSRSLAIDLNIHRKTVVAAYDELISQGWIVALQSKGTFVSNELPEVNPGGNLEGGRFSRNAPFEFNAIESLHRSEPSLPNGLTLDEGTPDIRIAPVTEIFRHYRSIISRSYNTKHLGYGSFYGDLSLREALVNHLQETRGLRCSVDQILITRGSQMAMYLSSQLLHRNGGVSIVGDTNYIAANLTLEHAGAEVMTVAVDEKGLVTKEVEILCEQHKITSVYVTSHHHHPTTVTMSAERRMHLVELSRKYGFAILEDDYDYDFHYQRAPLLPLISIASNGNVIYMGALCKIVAPAIRVGYMVAPKDFIESAGHLRRVIDRQGDAVMERVIAQMILHGDLQRHSRKALRLYHTRRDHFCTLLSAELGDYLNFEVPEGGMAVWALLNKSLSWTEIARSAEEQGLEIPNYLNYDREKLGHNGMRLGFASLNLDEQKRVIGILKTSILEQMASF
ncbi:PLP-dependent aminotransferase family protein [Roseivirga sp. E12]|uniref:aminotransferase-like domain-containing protein n=1 Tax=Roseivirga sp. E12 TaxID=2819237 RepID=UPI001ABC5A08|nr:PLP-dependent aminotransferase family protein [Roseivirga sp. E12]MBO3698615.1 PLP-dependent aminotransferase family protein [Roseivirga sp. E12]